MSEPTYIETTQPPTYGKCKTCYRAFGNRWPEVPQVVSPRGIEHIADDYGMMLCGRDGTGDGWWWPL